VIFYLETPGHSIILGVCQCLFIVLIATSLLLGNLGLRYFVRIAKRKKVPKKEKWIYIVYIIYIYIYNIKIYAKQYDVKDNMAHSLKFLELLPLELQEKVLEELSIHNKAQLEEIEIDGKIYKAEQEVLELIDGLVIQLELLEKANKKLRKSIAV